jgi:protein TonB
MQTTFYPRHTFKVEPATLAPARRPARAPSRVGDWYYHGLPKRARVSWVAVLVSLAVHGLVLWGGGTKPARRPVVVVKSDPIIQMEMPPLAEEEEKPVEELEDQAEVDPGVVVPRLVDLPTTVDLTNAFVQPLDLSIPLQTGLDTGSITNIPLKIAPGGIRGNGLKGLFNVSQLDRVPEPIVQAPPQFPTSLKKDHDHAEVVVEFIVDSRGETRDVRAISSTNTGFERAAVEGVSRWRFRPGMKDGRKVNTRMLVPIRFSVISED